MPAYNFKCRFEPMVSSGRKRQTIRARRKDGREARPGQTAYLFVLMRTKRCRRIGEGRIVSVDEIRMAAKRSSGLTIKLNGRGLDAHEADALALADGFGSVPEMRVFFAKTHGLPFAGTLVSWEPCAIGEASR